jgi:hypothetical protein
LGDWLYDCLHLLVAQAGAIILLCAGAWLGFPDLKWEKVGFASGPGRLLLIGGVFSACGAFWSWGRSKRITKLEKRVAEADEIQDGYLELVNQHESICQELVRVLLTSVASKFEFGDSERISIYGHNGTSFILAGRYSKHPEYAKAGRPSYPDNQGCIGTAWHDGVCFADNLPDAVSDKRRWADVMDKEWKIPRRVANQMAMKSRCIGATALEHSSNGKRIAVLVIESTKINRFGQSRIPECLGLPEITQLVRFLEIMETFAPNPDYARNEGY